MPNRIERLRSLPTGLRQRALIWGLVFAAGMAMHLGDLVTDGTDVYGWAPRPVEIFFLALVVLDAAVIVLIGLLQRAGVVLGLVTILAEVVVSWWALSYEAAPPDLPGPSVPVLTVFAVAVLIATPGLWAGLPHKAESERVAQVS